MTNFYFTVSSIIEKLRNIDYKRISSPDFLKQVVEPLNMSYNLLEQIILELDDDIFNLLRGRLWNEQCPDTDEYPEDPEKFYENTLPIVILLERIIKFRLPVCTDAHQKNSFLQQLAILKIQLNPSFLNKITNTQDFCDECECLNDECECSNDECEDEDEDEDEDEE